MSQESEIYRSEIRLFFFFDYFGAFSLLYLNNLFLKSQEKIDLSS